MKKILFLCAAVLLAGPAFAGDAEAVSAAINAFFSTAGGLAEQAIFVEDGKKLFGLLFVILVAWTGILSLFSDGGFLEAMAKTVRLFLVAGIAAFLLTQDVQRELVRGFDYFAARAASATGAPVDMSDPATGVRTVLSSGLRVALNLWRPSIETEDHRSWMQQLASEGLFQFLLYSFEEGLLKILITVFIVITLAIYVFVIASALVLTQIGLAMAPLMVPWMLWESTTFLFNSWLRFMVTAGVVKIVASLNLGMTWGLLEVVKRLADSATSTAAFDYFAYLTAFFLVMLMAFLMLQTYSIASGLVSGLPSVGMPNLPRPGGGNRGGGSNPGNTAPKPPVPNQ